MIQKPPFFNDPAQLEATDPSVSEGLSNGEFAAKVAETTPTVVAWKSKLSEDEIRLGEEAFLNALLELESLGKTAAELENERADKDRQVGSADEAFEPRQEQPIEEAREWRIATQEPLGEEEFPGNETPQTAEYELAGEEVHPISDDSSQGARLAESLTSEAEVADLPNQTPGIEGDLQPEALAAIATAPLGDNASETHGEDLDLPADVLSRLNSESSSERSVGLGELARLGGENAFHIIARAFDEDAEDVRNAAARALFDLQPDRAASFARTLREGSPERRRRVGAALASSGLAGLAIANLAGQTRELSYEAFSLLFLMTKAGEVQPLLRAIEDHPNIAVRLTVVKLLALNGQTQIVPYFRRLAVCGILPSEVRAAVIEALYELGRQIPRQPSAGAKI